jgi:hypothetical protein
MHPLTTLIESQRRQVRRQPSRPTPRRKSETEENAIVQGRTHRRSLVAVLAGLIGR